MTPRSGCRYCAGRLLIMRNSLLGFVVFPVRAPKRWEACFVSLDRKRRWLNLARLLWALSPSNRAPENPQANSKYQCPFKSLLILFCPGEGRSYCSTVKEQYLSAMCEPQSIWLSSLDLTLNCNLHLGEPRTAVLWEFLQTMMRLLSWFFFLSFKNPSGYFYFSSPFQFSLSFWLLLWMEQMTAENKIGMDFFFKSSKNNN